MNNPVTAIINFLKKNTEFLKKNTEELVPATKNFIEYYKDSPGDLLPFVAVLGVLGAIYIVKINFFPGSPKPPTPTDCDCPETWQTFLPDPASSIMEGLLIFNNHLLFVIVTIIILIGWFLANTVEDFGNFFNSNTESFFHNSLLEIIWTTTPALVLWSLASPSFSLLYSMDEISDPSLTLKILGHQWYWSYEISDFNTCKKKFNSLKFTCYMLSKDELRADHHKGFFRVLETGKRIILPTNTHIRLLVTATDVLHSWTIPSLGLKVDACPGRLNQLNVFIKRLGVFFGQCSEICGTNHGFMPIVLISLNSSQYNFLMMTNLERQ